MDRYTDWPWSWEEEVEWKADLEERDYDFLQELLDEAIEDGTTSSPNTLASGPENITEDPAPEEYFITA
jgi:hypothetical protein